MTLTDNNVTYYDLNYGIQQETLPISEFVAHEDIPSEMDTDFMVITSEVNDMNGVENEIPGPALSTQDDGLPVNATISSRGLTDLDDTNQASFTNSRTTPIELDRVPVELAQSLSTDRSEELSPKAAITDTNNVNSSTATSVRLLPQFVLPKISAPIINLPDNQKDQLQQLAFMRIVDAYKQVTVAGGSQARFSVLAHSGMEVKP